MLIRTLFLLIALVAIGEFAALNWATFTTPTPLSLGIATVNAPLGLVMLGLLGFMTLLFLVFVVYGQATALMDARRHARELQTSRDLADKAEASHLSDLRTYMEAQMNTLTSMQVESRAALQTRLDQLDQGMRTSVEQSGNTLAAYMGELEDRLERRARGTPPDALV